MPTVTDIGSNPGQPVSGRGTLPAMLTAQQPDPTAKAVLDSRKIGAGVATALSEGRYADAAEAVRQSMAVALSGTKDAHTQPAFAGVVRAFQQPHGDAYTGWTDEDNIARDPRFETKLRPDEERAFHSWKQQNAPHESGYDYDLRGAFRMGAKPDPKTGQLPATFAKPNHPTFSDQSMYSADMPARAGRFEGGRFISPEQGGSYPGADAKGGAAYGTGNERFKGGGFQIVDKGSDWPVGFAAAETAIYDSAANRPPTSMALRFKQKFADNPRFATAMRQAIDSVNRSSVSALGFDPRSTDLFDRGPGELDPAKATMGQNDTEHHHIIADVNAPAVLVHEATHSGLQELKTDERLPATVRKAIKDPATNEWLVRMIMVKHYGAVESSFKDPIQAAGYKPWVDGAKAMLQHPQWRMVLDEVERVAAMRFAEKHPGGPR